MMSDPFFQPVSGFDVPRYAGVPTFMRLPNLGLDDPKLAQVDIGLIGVPWDSGTTNRPGPRHVVHFHRITESVPSITPATSTLRTSRFPYRRILP